MRSFVASLMLCTATGCISVSAPKLPEDPLSFLRAAPTNVAVNLTSAPLEKDGRLHQAVQATAYFFAEKSGVPIQPSGDVRFLMFDRSVVPYKLVGDYTTKAADLKDHLTKDLVGDAYVFVLPYEPPQKTTVQVVAHFIPKKGPTIVSTPVTVPLKPAAEEVAASKPNASRPANYRQYTVIDGMQNDPNAKMVASQLPAMDTKFQFQQRVPRSVAYSSNPIDTTTPPYQASPMWSQQQPAGGQPSQQPPQQLAQSQIMQAQALQQAPAQQFQQQQQQQQQQPLRPQYPQQNVQQYQTQMPQGRMQQSAPPQNYSQQFGQQPATVLPGGTPQGSLRPGTAMPQSQFWNQSKQQSTPLQQQGQPLQQQAPQNMQQGGVQQAGYIGPGPGAAGSYAQ